MPDQEDRERTEGERESEREREREKLPDSGAKFCSTRLARPSTWVFHIVALACSESEPSPTGNKTNTRRGGERPNPTACASDVQSTNLGTTAKP